MGKRIGSSVLGIPIWIITGLAIFILFSTVYDWVVQDKSIIRYWMMIGSTVLIVIVTIILHIISLNTVAKQARRQLGS